MEFHEEQEAFPNEIWERGEVVIHSYLLRLGRPDNTGTPAVAGPPEKGTVARACDGYLNQREMEFHEEQGAFPNEIWERGDGHRPPLQLHRRTECEGYLNQREMEFREEQEAFPNEIWERGEVRELVAVIKP